MDDIPSKEEIIELARQLATSVDIEQLEKEGILEKKGAWYKIKKALPEHMSRQVRAEKTDGKGNSYIQLPKSWKKAQQLYKRMSGKRVEES
jgi:hypothetical protein